MNGSLNKTLKDVNGFAIYVMVFMTTMSIFSVFSESFGTIGFIIMFGAVMPITYIEKDRQKSWETYERMLPVSSRQVISSKFILTLICVAMFFACAVFGHIIGGVICKNAGGKYELPMPDAVTIIDTDLLKLLSFVSLIALAIAGILTVILYRFKNNPLTRFGLSFISIITGIGCSLLVNNDDEYEGPFSEVSPLTLIVTLAAAAVIYVICYFLSIKLYDKYKD